MPKIVDLHDYRTKAVEQRAFGPWQKRFGEVYDVKTRLSDLSDKTLFFMAQPGEDSSVAYYEMIMGVLDLGPATKFNYLETERQMQVVDIHLFLADHMRFEMMCRLNWLAAHACQKCSIIALVQNYKEMRDNCRNNPPGLSSTHPGHAAYQKLIPREKEVFIRQLLREALEAFEDRLAE
jgi:hypothetical protein